MKPHQLFAFGLLVAVPLLFLLAFHPGDGFHVSESLTLEFPGFMEIFKAGADSLRQDSTKISFATKNPAEQQRLLDSMEARRFQILYPHEDPSLFDNLFESMRTLGPGKKALHVLHFGGSQIEGDRITEHLRAKLQAGFGGNGPGWLPAIPYVGSRSFAIEYSDNWERHALFGLVDSTVIHQHYGGMGLYARFTPPADSLRPDTTARYAWIKYASRSVADQRVRTFSRFTLFYGYHTHPVLLRLRGGDQILQEAYLQPAQKTQVFQTRLPHTRRDLRLEFSGIESPEIFGVSLEGSSGILVSNISMRGQSGIHFWTQPAQQLRTMFGASQIGLVILQYGANVVPYITDEKTIQEYCNRFEKNIEYLKRLIPGLAVIVIGPADMALKKGTDWISYPTLPELRDAMKEAAFNAGAAYWDPYAAMGGAGTIQQWVAARPPLAVSDHVHFTLEGGEQIALWFYDALMKDYQHYVEKQVLNE